MVTLDIILSIPKEGLKKYGSGITEAVSLPYLMLFCLPLFHLLPIPKPTL